MKAILIVGIICFVCFVIELIILMFATKKPLHIHGNSKVLLTLFIDKKKYNVFKEAAKEKGYNKIEPYIEELINKDIKKQ